MDTQNSRRVYFLLALGILALAALLAWLESPEVFWRGWLAYTLLLGLSAAALAGALRVVQADSTARRATIVTTNLDADDLWAWVGPRVFSRLIELVGAPVLMQGEDYRLGGATA